ncbi:hypothetical protein Tco_0561294 [Tanacetum coccineum]
MYFQDPNGSATIEGETRGGAVSAKEGQSQEVVNAGNTKLYFLIRFFKGKQKEDVRAIEKLKEFPKSRKAMISLNKFDKSHETPRLGGQPISHVLQAAVDSYLPAVSASSYVYVSLLKPFLPIMNPAPESDETIRLAQESRSKLSDLIKTFDYKNLNNLYELFVPQREKSAEQRTKKPTDVPISTRKPKQTVNQSIATPHRRTVASESTIKNLEEPKYKTGNAKLNVSVPLRTESRSTNILEPKTVRESTLSNTPFSSNSFVARRNYPVHRRLWVLKAHGGKSQASDPIVTTSLNELDMLFCLMFDEYINRATLVVSKSSAVHTTDASDKRQQPDITSSTLTTVAADTTQLNIQTTPEPSTQASTVTATDNINQAKNVMVDDDKFINIFSTPVHEVGDSSSQHVDPSNMHTFYQ